MSQTSPQPANNLPLNQSPDKSTNQLPNTALSKTTQTKKSKFIDHTDANIRLEAWFGDLERESYYE